MDYFSFVRSFPPPGAGLSLGASRPALSGQPEDVEMLGSTAYWPHPSDVVASADAPSPRWTPDIDIADRTGY